MKIKAVLITFIISLLLTVPEAFAGSHDKTFGVAAGYVSRNKSASAGIYFQYGFSQKFRLAAQTAVDFRRDNRDAWFIDFNAQFPILRTSRFEFYPLVGLNYSAWSLHTVNIDSGKDVTNRRGNIGLNAGLGAGLRITSTMKLSLEGMYTGVKQNNAARISLGIGYCF